MKKLLPSFTTLCCTFLILSGCNKPELSAGKGLSSGFLHIPVGQSYTPGCGLELCYCENAKQRFSYTKLK